jgi:hypothetical protein
MQSAVTNLLAGMLLIQALTGWCCQHRCAAGLGHRPAAEASPESNCCDQCDCRSHSSQDSKESDAPCRCPDCLGFCTYLPPDKAPLDSSQLEPGSETLAIAPALAYDHFVCRHGRSFSAESGLPEPPLRLHLLHQLLVI